MYRLLLRNEFEENKMYILQHNQLHFQITQMDKRVSDQQIS